MVEVTVSVCKDTP